MSKIFPECTRLHNFETISSASLKVGHAIGELKGLYQNEIPVTQTEVDVFYSALLEARRCSNNALDDIEAELRMAVMQLEEK